MSLLLRLFCAVMVCPLLLPQTVFADCIMTDTPYKFEIVCSGDGDKPKPAGTKSVHTAHRTHRAVFEGHSKKVVMTDEEIMIMEMQNRSDGYRSRQPLKKANSVKPATGRQGTEA